jgi:GNAT superfamily N-acetyltransferase
MVNSSELVVRPFEPDDATAVSGLIAITMRESNARDYPVDRLEALIAYFTPEKLRTLAEERDCLVVLQQSRVIATAAREGSELATFFVHPARQGHGVGSRLLEQLEQRALRAGVARLKVDASLTGADFYERRGYQRTGRIVPGGAGPQITLVKELASLAG